jgi:hypothetical protein
MLHSATGIGSRQLKLLHVMLLLLLCRKPRHYQQLTLRICFSWL